MFRSFLVRAPPRWVVGASIVAAPIVYWRERIPQAVEPYSRFTFSALVAAHIALDYKLNLPNYEHRDYYRVRSIINQRSADDLLWLCRRHGGTFTKAGQLVASLDHVLPAEYTKTMSVLQDRAPAVPFSDVVKVFDEDMGIHPSEVFSEFDEEALASASLAQVHRARLRTTNEEVAVKVQYPRLSSLFRSDIRTMNLLARILLRIFPDYDLRWLVKDLKTNLLKELDFEQEGRRAERTALNFAGKRSLHIPRIHWDVTSNRILTMEFIHGMKIDNDEQLKSLGFDSREVANNFSAVFAEMIHCFGYVHCDPHPGNVFVRDNPDYPGEAQLVLLDHGLYRELDENFRDAYSKLWKAMVTHDTHSVLTLCRRLGIQDQYVAYIPIILVQRSMSSRAKLGQRWNREKRNRLVEKLRGVSLSDYNEFLASLPKDLMLVLKTHDLVRSVNKALGGVPSDRLKTFFHYAILGTYRTAAEHVRTHRRLSWWQRIHMFFSMVLISFRMWAYESLPVAFVRQKSLPDRISLQPILNGETSNSQMQTA